jgi:hypothetical protein
VPPTEGDWTWVIAARTATAATSATAGPSRPGGRPGEARRASTTPTDGSATAQTVPVEASQCGSGTLGTSNAAWNFTLV